MTVEISPIYVERKDPQSDRLSRSPYARAIQAHRETEVIRAEADAARLHLGKAKLALLDRNIPDPLI